MKNLLFVASLTSVGAAWAECPPVPDQSDRLAAIYENLRAAPNEGASREYTNQLWDVFAAAPDEAAQAILDRGLGARRAFDFVAALDAFNALIEYCPDYAEGYNQRAFVLFLQEDYEPARIDLEAALVRSPDHVAAKAGLALTLSALGRSEEGQAMLREALELNPWLPERKMLVEPAEQEL